MAAWAWTLITVGMAVAVGLIVAAMLTRRRTTRLRHAFGGEYDRTVQAKEGRRPAEAELRERERERAQYSVKALPDATRMRFASEWRGVQERFVDHPSNAVLAADDLVSRVMGARGYPVETFAARANVISVDHPDIVDNYRQAHRVYHRAQSQQASTEDLRGALLCYRSIFDQLLQPSGADVAVGDGRHLPAQDLARASAVPVPGDGASASASAEDSPRVSDAQPSAAIGPLDGGDGYAADAARRTPEPTAQATAARPSLPD